MSLVCPYTKNGYRLLYTDDNIIKQWFHDLCRKLHSEEKKYFQSINPFNIKLDKVEEYASRYHIYFNNDKVNDIAWTNTGYDKNVTEGELDIFIGAYENIEKSIENITNEVESKLGNIEAE